MERKTRVKTIEIRGMTGDACVQTVIAALKRVSGVTIDGVQIGRADIICGYPAALSAACTAITSAGFRSSPLGSPNGLAHPVLDPLPIDAPVATPGRDPTVAATQAMTSEGAGGAIGGRAGKSTKAPADDAARGATPAAA